MKKDVATKALTPEEFRHAVLALALYQSRLYRTAATAKTPFDVTECEFAGCQQIGKPVASYTLNIDGSYERRDYDGKRTQLNFAISPDATGGIVCSGTGFFGGRGFMVEANGEMGLMWIS